MIFLRLVRPITMDPALAGPGTSIGFAELIEASRQR
jgi:hypothetical protein